MATSVKAKKRCCQERPRCKRCPVVLRRLERAGRAERTGKRTYMLRRVKKKHLRRARAA
ncbi:MAG: hypothetical protein M3Z33_01190 [Actinomycetota bacterium]|nr:hypothetical protein [Actinomycetota bacterium]